MAFAATGWAKHQQIGATRQHSSPAVNAIT
jgi:hypothetical protein